MIGFGQIDFTSMFANLWGSTSSISLSDLNPFQMLLLVLFIIVLAIIIFTDKGYKKGSSSGRYQASEIETKRIDETTNQIVLRSTGKVLFTGTREQCSDWKRANVASRASARR